MTTNHIEGAAGSATPLKPCDGLMEMLFLSLLFISSLVETDRCVPNDILEKLFAALIQEYKLIIKVDI